MKQLVGHEIKQPGSPAGNHMDRRLLQVAAKITGGTGKIGKK